jgi:hypothetical protein
MARHGLSTYTNHGCRCDVCRASMAAYRRDHRRRVRGRVPPEVPHGSSGTYCNYGCRCRSCSDAHAADKRRRYRSRTEAVG